MCLSNMEPLIKGFKVSDEKTKQRKGIACKHLEELKEKIWQKFYEEKGEDEDKEKLKIYTDDGTEVDDSEYLMNLPANTLLIASRWQEHLIVSIESCNTQIYSNGLNAPRRLEGKSYTAENIFDEVLSLMR